MPIMRDTIKKHLDFKTKDSDPSARCAYFLIRVKPVKDIEKPRYGLVVTKKTFKHAIDRNRAKRLLRDWIRFNEKLLKPEWDYVFIARSAILDTDRTTGREAMRKALAYLRNQELNAK